MLKELMNSYILDKMKDIEYSINTKVMARIGIVFAVMSLDDLEVTVASHQKFMQALEDKINVEREKAEKSSEVVRNMHQVVEKISNSQPFYLLTLF